MIKDTIGHCLSLHSYSQIHEHIKSLSVLINTDRGFSDDARREFGKSSALGEARTII